MNDRSLQTLREAVEPLADLVREVDSYVDRSQTHVVMEEGDARRLLAAVRDALGRAGAKGAP